MNLSIIVPLLNEAESLPELHQWILDELKSTNLSFELIFIDDGSSDNSWEEIEKLHQSHNTTYGIRFSKNFGKSQALHAGFAEASGDVVVTLDADLQDAPSEIPNLYQRIVAEDLDMISGWKKKRYDSLFFKNIPSKLFNWAARRSSGIYLHDFNCGIKAYRRDVIKTVEVYGEMHRYIPVLAAHAGFTKIGEQIVQHQARKYGVTKFGWIRFVNGFLDLITLSFLNKFGKRPMHFFGFWGSLMFLIGFGAAFYLGIDKLYLDPDGRLITQRPEFFIALTTMILGTQFFVAGFLGELWAKQKNQKRYTIKKTLKAL
ncbi:MAG: glycosyltransferase family 2 protein [Flavobacteriaceae bacterium]|nr:glycosyltransferase family 2 protein [Flavobacteriaceae bacterium]MDO7603503.1 glycosyltransferase family 2 protein [Flavobacteriaceae bacterium]MDO7615676.1 glycosyltransferase family 2 protein [Flavobacteriaceae bacterium]